MEKHFKKFWEDEDLTEKEWLKLHNQHFESVQQAVYWLQVSWTTVFIPVILINKATIFSKIKSPQVLTSHSYSSSIFQIENTDSHNLANNVLFYQVKLEKKSSKIWVQQSKLVSDLLSDTTQVMVFQLYYCY